MAPFQSQVLPYAPLARLERVARRPPVAPHPVPLESPTDAALASESLLQGQREVLIRHNGEVYRLRHTRNDKLILTK